MFEKFALDAEDRGQVGIGTLIIFIALVLVAAVAAGVLINTSGLLQAQAEDTGADAQSQVSNQIEVVSATGETDADGVSTVRLVVKKSAGSDPIDLTEATIQYTSDGSSYTMDVATGDVSQEVLDDNGERATVTLSMTELEGSSLAAGEKADLQIVDQSGASTFYGINVPDVLTGKSYVRV